MLTKASQGDILSMFQRRRFSIPDNLENKNRSQSCFRFNPIIFENIHCFTPTQADGNAIIFVGVFGRICVKTLTFSVFCGR